MSDCLLLRNNAIFRFLLTVYKVSSTDFEDGLRQWFTKCSYSLCSSLGETMGGKRELLEQSVTFGELYTSEWNHWRW